MISPPDFWHDSIWQFIGVVVALILGVGSYILWFVAFRKQRNRKEVTYEIISDTSVLNIGKEVEGKIEIRFDSKLVSDLRLVVLRISNSGDIPIAPNDFIEPLCFEFGNNSEVLETEVLETIPSNIKVYFDHDQKTITMKPLLLNAKDSIKIKVLLTGTSGEIAANARIFGVQQIFKVNRIDAPLQSAYLEQVRKREMLLQKRNLVAYIYSWFLDLLAGYGYKPSRTVVWYLIVIFAFAALYSLLGHLPLIDSLVLSISSFHGRGFFISVSNATSLHNPLVVLAAFEAVIGLFIVISFIATFTQRYFGK